VDPDWSARGESHPTGITVSRVLVVEDDPWIQWMIADDLADRGFEVLTADDGVKALGYIGEIRPDVIVLDLMLPRLNGWQFLDRYHAVTGGAVIPIVVVTAARSADVANAAHGGVCKYLPKPFDIEELAHAVAQLASPQPTPSAV
jgi:DNA-binding response OmpR family regulator